MYSDTAKNVFENKENSIDCKTIVLSFDVYMVKIIRLKIYILMDYKSISFKEKLKTFSDLWQPKVFAEMNDYQFKLVKIKGEFIWHKHDDTDEVFIVLEGEMEIEFRDGSVEMKAGEMFVIPKNIEHKPVAYNECKILLVEPRGVVNTGNSGGDLQAENDVWI